MTRTTCFMSSSGCSAVSFTPLLRLFVTAAREFARDILEEELCFMLCRPSQGHYSNDVVYFGMDNRHGHTVQQSKGNKSLLIVTKAVIFVGRCQASKDLMGISEVETVFFEVQSALVFVPLELH